MKRSNIVHVDVVIISDAKDAEFRALTQKCLDSLYSSEIDIMFHPYIIESAKNVAYNWGETINPPKPFGYHKYCNLGRKAGNSPYVVLCNNDIVFQAGWATRILIAMEQYPEFLSASPWCPQVHTDKVKGELKQGYGIKKYITGWCIFQKREIYDQIGDLDERFKFWYCDNDYALTLKDKGIKHFLVCDSIVDHHNGALGATANSLSAKKKDKLMHNAEKLIKEKWLNGTRG